MAGQPWGGSGQAPALGQKFMMLGGGRAAVKCWLGHSGMDGKSPGSSGPASLSVTGSQCLVRERTQRLDREEHRRHYSPLGLLHKQAFTHTTGQRLGCQSQPCHLWSTHLSSWALPGGPLSWVRTRSLGFLVKSDHLLLTCRAPHPTALTQQPRTHPCCCDHECQPRVLPLPRHWIHLRVCGLLLLTPSPLHCGPGANPSCFPGGAPALG